MNYGILLILLIIFVLGDTYFRNGIYFVMGTIGTLLLIFCMAYAHFDKKEKLL